MCNTMKICPMLAGLLHADGRTDRPDEADSPFHNFVNVPKNAPKMLLHRVTLNWDYSITAHVFK